MPKKFKGENSKAVEARARKAAAKAAVDEAKQRAAEDEYWRDDDKHVAKKQARKDAQEKKRQEQLERKKENERLYQEEVESMKSAKAEVKPKLTRAEIAAHQETMAAEAAAERKKKEQTVVTDLPIEENINRLETEGEARGVEEAIAVLSVKEAEMDRHPERRVKAAYTAFEEREMPRLKAENPNMRLSQLKQMLKKDWMKSPENPMNQRHAAFNAK